MAKEIPSVGDLRRKSEVTEDEIEAATAAYLKDEGVEAVKVLACALTDAVKRGSSS